jgi:uncharacterized protein (DUF2141 family)
MIHFLQLASLWSVLHLSSEMEDGRLLVKFENVKTIKGSILVGIYRDEKSWGKKEPALEYVITKKGWTDGNISVILDGFEKGAYAIAVLDDINDNQIVDMGFIFPKEGFGFSNYEHHTWSLPRFCDFAFTVPECKEITIKMRYLDF